MEKLHRKGSGADSEGEAGADTKRLDRQLQILSNLVQRFRIQGQRFLVGDLPVPPDELREKIQHEFRRLRSSNLKGAAVTFRLSSLEAKFNSQLDLFGRRLRGREEAGRAASVAGSPQRLDPVQGIVFGREMDPDATKALYGGLQDPSMSFDKFRSYLSRQAEVIRSKTGCSEIKFRVAVQDGKMKLKAKPVRS